MKKEPIRDEFLEKRKMRQRKARKRRLIIGFVFFLTALVVTSAILCVTVFFPIKSITAVGSKIYSSSEIINQSGINKGDNIFTFGEKSAVSHLKEKLPFIEKVEFKRILPDKLEIKVSDARAYYCYKQGNAYFNISKKGWVLEETAEKTDGVFEVLINKADCKIGQTVSFSDQTQYEILNNLIEILEDNELKIDYVDVTDTVSLKVGVEGRFDVELGTENDIENKVLQLKKMTETLPKNKKGLIRLYMWTSQKPDGTFVENNTK